MVNLNVSIIYLFLCSYMVLYFMGPLGHVLNIFSFLLFFLLLISLKIKYKYTLSEFYFLFFIFLMILLSLVLNVFGYSSGGMQKDLVLYVSIVVFLSILVFLNIDDANLFKLILFLFTCEFITIFLQFTYLYFGFGLQPVVELDYMSVQGMSLNPNNTSVIFALYYFYLAIFLINTKKHLFFYIISFFAFFAFILLVSRTVLLCFLLFFFVSVLVMLKKNIKFNIFFIFLFGFLFFNFNFNFNFDDYLKLDKIESISVLSSDDSANFRYISFVRLFENIANIGMGTLSVGDYGHFYQSADDDLMKSNPHVFFSEYSFLFGYSGFFVSFGLFISLIWKLLKNSSINSFIKIPLIISILLFQAVPSSILTIFNFFPLMVIIVCTNYSITSRK